MALRIITGKHRGRKIESVPGKEVRPTTGFAREAIFNVLMHGRYAGENSPLVGKRVVDIFCGTGAMGFEALSRGAAHVTLIDQNQKAMDAARQTAEKFGETANVSLIRSDSTNLPRAIRPCTLAFIDPPYEKGLAEKALHSVTRNGWLEDGAIVVVEQSKKEKLELPPEYTLLEERTYSISRMSLLQYQAAQKN